MHIKFLFPVFLIASIINPLYGSNREIETKEIDINPYISHNVGDLYQTEALVNLPPELLLKIIPSDAPTLFTLSKVNKFLNEFIEQYYFLTAISEFYKKINEGSSELNSWFDSHEYTRVDSKGKRYKSNREAFRIGFRYLVFGIGSTPDETKVLLPTYGVIRYWLSGEERSVFPQDLLTDYSNEFQPILPKEKICFNYPKVFKLFLEQEKVGVYLLEQAYIYFKNLKNCDSKDPQVYHIILHGKYSYVGLEKIINFYNQASFDSEFKPLFYKLGILTKNVLLSKGKLDAFFKNPSSINALKFIQSVPVNLETYQEELPIFMDEVESDILAIAHKRWNILEELNAYLSIG